MSLVILGLDPSWTATGMAVLIDGRLAEHHTVHTQPTSPDMQRVATIARELVNIVRRVHPDLAAIEGYSFGSSAGRERMGELGGILRWTLYLEPVAYEVWPVARWRKAVLGAKAPREKAQVGMALAQRFRDWAIDDLNALEAAAVAYTAWLHRQPAETWTRFQCEAFKEPKKKTGRKAA